jgi:hypothetical protein
LVKISRWNRGWNRGYVPKMAEDYNVGCCQKHLLYQLMLRRGVSQEISFLLAEFLDKKNP